MTKSEIEKIKKIGSKEHLLKTISGQLWDAKRACENASADCCKNLPQQITKAMEALEDAKQLFEEASKI